MIAGRSPDPQTIFSAQFTNTILACGYSFSQQCKKSLFRPLQLLMAIQIYFNRSTLLWITGSHREVPCLQKMLSIILNQYNFE